MNELQRQAYLEAMGVEVLLPRAVLPAALPSMQCEMPDLVAVDQLSLAPEINCENNNSTQVLASARRTGAMAALLNEVGAEKRTATLDAAAEKKEQLRIKTSMVVIPRFCLEFFAVGRWLFIDAGAAVGSRDYQKLLQNLCFALGLKPTGMEVIRFKWPLVEGSHIDQSESAALQTLKAFIARQAKQHQIQYIAAMGDQAKTYVSKHAELMDFENLGIAEVLTIPSLASAFDQPELKPIVWNAFKALLRKSDR